MKPLEIVAAVEMSLDADLPCKGCGTRAVWVVTLSSTTHSRVFYYRPGLFCDGCFESLRCMEVMAGV